MFIEVHDRFTHPTDVVFPTLRDRLSELLPYMPDVGEVTLVTREADGDGKIRIVNRWRSTIDIPKEAQGVLPPDLFAWTDTALWDERTLTVEFRLDGYGYTATGVNYFRGDDTGTGLRVTTTVKIDPDAFQVPPWLFDLVSPVIETKIREVIEGNVRSMCRGLHQFLDADR